MTGLPRLWFVTDAERGTAGRPLLDVIRAAARGGVEAVLLREFAVPTSELAAWVDALAPERRRGLAILVSRRLDLCRGLGLDGVQLTADSVPVDRARTWLGPETWVGYSAHSAEEAREVALQGVDYVTLSPIYATSSKPDVTPRGPAWLEAATKHIPVPTLALGGVTPERSNEMVNAGAYGVAAVSAIGAASDVESAARSFRAALPPR